MNRLCMICVLAAACSGSPRPAARGPVNLPLAFEPNRGQLDARVAFLGRGPDYHVFVATDGAAWVVPHRGDAPVVFRPVDAASPVAADATWPALARMTAASAAIPLVPRDPLPGVVSYFSADGALAGLPTFASIEAHPLPGIDLAFSGWDGRLSYALTVAPGRDPAAFAFDVYGARSVAVDSHGELVIATPDGRTLRHSRPIVFQTIAGQRRSIEGAFAVRGSRVAFAVGPHDPSAPLEIDPSVAYASYLGGGQLDIANAVTVDHHGAVYLTGYTTAGDFPGSQVMASGQNLFVTKLDPSGTAIVYTAILGDGGQAMGNAIAVDHAGRAYVVGDAHGSQYPTTPGAFQTAPNDSFGDAVVTVLSPSGTHLVYSTFLGGHGNEYGRALVLDPLGRIYALGDTYADVQDDFPVTAGAFDPTPTLHGSTPRGWVALIDPWKSGAASRRYASYVGKLSVRTAGIALGQCDDVFVLANQNGGPPGLSGPPCGSPPLIGAFILGVTPTLSSIRSLTCIGTLDTFGGAIGSAGHDLFVVGETTEALPVTANALQPVRAGQRDVYLMRLDSAVTPPAIGYLSYLGGTALDGATAVAPIGFGMAWVAGSTASTDFPLAHPTQPALAGARDTFVTLTRFDGSPPVFSTYFGGTDIDDATGVAVHPALGWLGHAWVSGFTRSLDLPTTGTAVQPVPGGDGDAYLARFTK